jgi:hypothetical protein
MQEMCHDPIRLRYNESGKQMVESCTHLTGCTSRRCNYLARWVIDEIREEKN